MSMQNFVPDEWAFECLALLYEKRVASRLVDMRYSNEIATQGETINVQKIDPIKAMRLTPGADTLIQNPSSTQLQIKLDQHIYSKFRILDVHMAKSFRELIPLYLVSAAEEIATKMDRMVVSQMAQFLSQQTGWLGGLSDTNIVKYITKAREKMNIAKLPEAGRVALWNPSSETVALNTDLFISAERVGDEGTAMREASLGRKFGFDNYMTQNMPTIIDGVTEVKTFLINNAGGYVAGTKVLTVDTGTGVIPVNSFVKVGGTCCRVVAKTDDTGNTRSITVSPGINNAVADNEQIVVSTAGAVNFAAGYVAGETVDIVVDAFPIFPKVGQFVSFGNSAVSPVYAIIEIDEANGKIQLDRPLEQDVADNAPVQVSPNGAYSFAYLPEGITMVARTMAATNGFGAMQTRQSLNEKMGIRVTMAYDHVKVGMIVMLDLLCGIKAIRPEFGVVLVG